MALQAWLLTNGDTVYVERTAVQYAQEHVYGETNLFVGLNDRLRVDDFYTAVRDKLEEAEAIEIFTSIVEIEAKAIDPKEVGFIEPRDAGTSWLTFKSSRRVRIDQPALTVAEALGYSA